MDSDCARAEPGHRLRFAQELAEAFDLAFFDRRSPEGVAARSSERLPLEGKLSAKLTDEV